MSTIIKNSPFKNPKIKNNRCQKLLKKWISQIIMNSRVNNFDKKMVLSYIEIYYEKKLN